MRKVAIVGGASSSQHLAPHDDRDWDIWVLGNQLKDYEGKRVSLIFEIHDNLSNQKPEYPQWVVEAGPPVMVGPKFPIQHERVIRYPKKAVNALMGTNSLSSSIAYMFGMAVLLEYDEIAIYGVELLADNHEYFKQRPGVYAWIGYAKGRGIKVTIPDESPLFKDTYDEGRDWLNSK